MNLIVPGGPGLKANTVKPLACIVNNSVVLPYEISNEKITPKEAFEEIVTAGVQILSEVSANERNVIGHSFGGLIAKAISNKIKTKNTILLGTPIDKSCYQNVFDNYSLKADEITKKLGAKYSENPTDNTLANWLSSYGKLYFSEDFIEAGGKMLMEDSVNSKIFSKMSQYGFEICEEVFEEKSHGRIVTAAGLKDELINTGSLLLSSIKFNLKFCEITQGSHFSIFESPESIKFLIEKGET